MRPYGMRPGEYSDYSGGPPTKYAPDISSAKRTVSRRKMHKIGRKMAREAIADSILESLFRPGRNKR